MPNGMGGFTCEVCGATYSDYTWYAAHMMDAHGIDVYVPPGYPPPAVPPPHVKMRRYKWMLEGTAKKSFPAWAPLNETEIWRQLSEIFPELRERVEETIRNELPTTLADADNNPVRVLSCRVYDLKYTGKVYTPVIPVPVGYKFSWKAETVFEGVFPASPIAPAIVAALPWIVKAVLLIIAIAVGAWAVTVVLDKVTELWYGPPEEFIEEFKCGVCNETFTTAGSLDVHLLEVHSIKRFTCPVCGTSYSSEEMRDKCKKSHEKPTFGEFAPLLMLGIMVLAFAGMGRD